MSTATLLTPVRHTAATAPVRAPRRFDTHHVRAIEGRLHPQSADGSGQLVVDASDVAFVDRDAVDVLVAHGLGRIDGGVRIERPSLAMQITLELLGHVPADAPLERAA